jgi:succinyl-diaminopimelate desuccinylase
MEELLAKLVAMPTISEDAAANNVALDYLEGHFKQCGMHIKRFEYKGHGSLIATVKPDTKHVKVMLYGHIDVIPADEQAFTLRHEGDKLFGRGVLDMKYAIAAYMQAAEQLQGLDDYDFAIMITSDEEFGGRDGINSILYLLNQGYSASVVILPDGGRAWDVEAVAKGHWRFDLVTSGRSAHGSRPWEGDSASFKLIQALHELRERFKDQGPDTDTLNIGKIRGNGTYNQVPSSATAQVELRLAADGSHQKNAKFIDQLCEKYGLSKIERTLTNPLYQDTKNPLIEAFMKSITKITGHTSKPCLSLAGSDAVYFKEFDIPCAVTYPPGGGHHSENEWISREALLQMPDIVIDYLNTVAKK